ncbi:uncharacterized protein SAPINGB_P006321 [Magnusiomyces paraingens]|uniref:ribose-phosphate diphosphokinase n=1 Tax=Magnusiomyces paraingens TaxID=2606893 RepID=A0A5E8C5I5_9ASCO|nr:uncharacterized protein SAPINGB_P006321 [Saprochaete ingens]VVT58662.1 unnamed protein product [Saprochaete ingens]
MRNLVVLGGSSHPALVDRVCRNLNISPCEATLSKFANGETSITIKESVREKDVYVLQSASGAVNDHFIELLVMISACKTASARKVTAVLPLFPYSRQPDAPYAKRGAPLKKVGGTAGSNGASSSGATGTNGSQKPFTFESVPSSPKPANIPSGNSSSLTPLALTSSLNRLALNQRPALARTDSWQPEAPSGHIETNTGYKEWVAQPGTLIASLLMAAGADHIITMDLHDPQFQGYFDVPVDNLYGRPLLQHYITTCVPNYADEAVIVSPDAGGAKRATAVADALGMPFALIHKERRRAVPGSATGGTVTPTPGSPGNVSAASIVGAAARRLATTMLVGNVHGKIAILVDDLVDTANTITRAAKLLKDQGATMVIAVITHGIFSGDAIERINASAIDKVVTTNTAPQDEHMAQLGDKLEVLDVGRVFAEAIRRIHNGESVSMLFDHVGI